MILCSTPCKLSWKKNYLTQQFLGLQEEQKFLQRMLFKSFEKLSLIDKVSVFSIFSLSFLILEYKKIQNELLQESNQLNITKNLNTSFLIFNRTPKAGSEMIWTLIDRLSVKNEFKNFRFSQNVKKHRGGENTYFDEFEQKIYIDMFRDPQAVTVPFSYVKHINFLNFEDFGHTNPIYINFVRHPIDRVISWYYYVRQNWYQLEFDRNDNNFILKDDTFSPASLKRSFEDCIKLNLSECRYEFGQSIHWNPGGPVHFSQVR